MGRTRFSLMAGLSAPMINFWAALVKSARPAMGRYSWLRFGSLRRISSACGKIVSYSIPEPSSTIVISKSALSFLHTLFPISTSSGLYSLLPLYAPVYPITLFPILRPKLLDAPFSPQAKPTA